MTIHELVQLGNIREEIVAKAKKYALAGLDEAENDFCEIYTLIKGLEIEVEKVLAEDEETLMRIKNGYGGTMIFVKCCEAIVSAIDRKDIHAALRDGNHIFATHSGVPVHYCPICGTKILIKNNGKPK